MSKFNVGDRVMIVQDMGGDTPEVVLKTGVIDSTDFPCGEGYNITIQEFPEATFHPDELQLIEGTP